VIPVLHDVHADLVMNHHQDEQDQDASNGSDGQ
jgi:hypothetical protein